MAESTFSGGTVQFNVGGQHFMLFSSTLSKHPDCLLYHLASGTMRTITDSNGAICIDRDPTSFNSILTYLRYDLLPKVCDLSSDLLQCLLSDSKFYRLPQLEEALEFAKEETLIIPESNSTIAKEVLELNIGGINYAVSKQTLINHSDSMLGAMFKGPWPAARVDSTNRYFIDRDGHLFRHILNYIRSGVLNLPEDFVEFDQLLAEADFYQISGLEDSIQAVMDKKLKKREPGIYLEVKDTMVWFRGFHINTSLVGPLQHLRQLSPFKEEFEKCVHEGPSRFNLEPFYTSWSKGVVEEIYLNFQHSKSRLEWAMLLKAAGWRLLGSSVCCSSSNDQTFIMVDKWFIATDNLPSDLFTGTSSLISQETVSSSSAPSSGV